MTARFEDPQAALIALTRKSFLFFLTRCFPFIRGGELLALNWHLEAMACQLARVQSRECRRLLVTLPPRNLKSITISVAWVAWMLGQNPALNFVCVSYSNELSGKLARDCLTIMQSSWYKEAFPGAIIANRRAAADFETTRHGGRLATSITGTLTGRGGDIIILDDVIKPDEADSEVAREHVNEWYRSTLASRLNDKSKGAIITVMQRLHQFDLPGMLLEQNGNWDHLNLPAIAPEDETIPLLGGKFHHRKAGDVLHHERENHAALMLIKDEMGSARFAAQYLQNPVPAEGNIVKAAWLRTYPESLGRSGGYIMQSWDTATKTGPNNAYSACVTTLIKGKHTYLLDVFRKRMEFTELCATVVRLAREFNARDLLIEDKASGEQLIQHLRATSPMGVPEPIPVTPSTDKSTRLEGIAAMIEAGQLLLPAEAPWLPEFKSELLGAPHTRFRDQVDALSQLMDRVRLRLQMPVSSNAGPELIEEGSYSSEQWEPGDRFPEGVSAMRFRFGRRIPLNASSHYDGWQFDDPWL